MKSIRLAAALLLLLFAMESRACDVSCLGLKVRELPAIEIRPGAGAYSRGTIFIADPQDCKVYLHEFVHHWQWQQWGDAEDANEWWRREWEAVAKSRRCE